MTSDNNFDAAEESYARFLSLLKVGTVATIIVTILVVVLIS
ncbi:aa3-type cytochrome c oxidase subunit IV [Parasphingorhabdus flavimaris]|uniref:Aa3-type cytochrome c oxidase subunit IV n=1 Tax=Parasphingorhabdus flavimaris TaxID=266812 RepID=A0ABX2N3H6_9SPHN|nr:aa3-type cytochrome c oxidase subunit IV [Parasphingorhabdus flavimaris]NVD28224.1 aa3-type cytochrome c oxidase subunit IV [Parasphingorhabdus flavimaris]|tara:strand:+ start:41289 stop:41411 length:123 start_codon:yes stop_codon:yes gene_type:complete